MKKTIKVTHCLLGSLKIDDILIRTKEIPEEFRDSAFLEARHYGWDSDIDINLCYKREETDDEYNIRKKDEEGRMKYAQDQEYLLYQKLKAKFEEQS